MGCCGSTIKKVRQIATGYVNLARGKKHEFTDDRVRACQECDESTWLTKAEYGKWLVKHGVGILRNREDLAALPMLPKEENGRGKGLYCRICKCFVPAKAHVDYETQLTKLKELLEAGGITQDACDEQVAEIRAAMCPLDKWEK